MPPKKTLPKGQGYWRLRYVESEKVIARSIQEIVVLEERLNKMDRYKKALEKISEKECSCSQIARDAL
jgi:predicted transcriptional regulator